MKIPALQRKYNDKTFWVIYIILVVVALFAAADTFNFSDKNPWGAVLKQSLFIISGIVIVYFVQYIPTKTIRLLGWGFLVISLVSLWSLLIPHNPFAVTINGATRWFKLFGFTFQPSELAKIGLVISVSDLLSRPALNDKGEEDEKLKDKRFFISLGLTAVVCLPILKDNLSTALLLAGIVFLIWILSRQKPKYILSTLGIALIFLCSGYFIVKFGYIERGKKLPSGIGRASVWVKRIDAVFTRHSDEGKEFKITNENYQRTLAQVAVMRGGASPVGVLPGNSQERDFLPLAYADYIFAIIVEETGIVGSFFLIFIYLAILFRACYASSRYTDYSAMLMMMGIALTITCQALISMAVSVGIGPVTGQPLPLISRGGTSVWITSAAIGIMFAVAREQNMLKDKAAQSAARAYEQAEEITLNNDTI